MTPKLAKWSKAASRSFLERWSNRATLKHSFQCKILFPLSLAIFWMSCSNLNQLIGVFRGSKPDTRSKITFVISLATLWSWGPGFFALMGKMLPCPWKTKLLLYSGQSLLWSKWFLSSVVSEHWPWRFWCVPTMTSFDPWLSCLDCCETLFVLLDWLMHWVWIVCTQCKSICSLVKGHSVGSPTGFPSS